MALLVAAEFKLVTKAALLVDGVVTAKVFCTSKLEVDNSRTAADNRRAAVRVKVDIATSASWREAPLAKPVLEART